MVGPHIGTDPRPFGAPFEPRPTSADPLGSASAADPANVRPGYSQPLSRAMRTASARLRAAVFWMAVER